ncbi:hypothetical protein G7054_g12024 [Neopestalotiopsis clavispora]|nr:hypothetical protein G7054_g12024 [Neopestalotiopsis clavispora]
MGPNAGLLPHLESNDEIEKPPSVDSESSDYHIRPADTSRLRGKRRFGYVAKLALLVATLVFFIAVFAYLRIAVKSPQNTKCVDPVKRREWRQLTSTERSDYITAVKCLHDLTSRVSGHAKLSDDFGWTHSMAGTYSMDWTFLTILPITWLQLTIFKHITLRRSFLGIGTLYTSTKSTFNKISVIWDPVTGFGGDGQGNDTVYIGSCIRDGPFSDYVVSFYNFTYNPHCLSRGIGRDNGQPHKFSGADVTPAAISTVMQEKTFFNFSIALENGPHATIPHLVNGDFFSFEAPNESSDPDPLFILHHAQLDRLWWKWQRTGPGRDTEYNGPKERYSKLIGGIDDVLPMRGLGPDITIRDTFDTQSGLFCYTY